MLALKLPDAVNDENLYGIDEYVFDVTISSSDTSDNKVITARGDGVPPVVLEIEGDGYLGTTASASSGDTSVSVGNTYVTRYLSAGNYKLHVKNRSNLVDLYFSDYNAANKKRLVWGNPLIGATIQVGMTNVSTEEIFNLKDFTGTALVLNNADSGILFVEGSLSDLKSNITRIILRGQKVSGNLTDLASKTLLTDIRLDSNVLGADGIQGSVESLGLCTWLRTLTIQNSTSVNGDVYSMLDAMAQAGKTSSLSLRIVGCSTTNDGVAGQIIKTVLFNSSYPRGWQFQ